MVQITPETSTPGDYLRGYYYSQDTIRRFSLVEHYSGWPDGSQGKGLLMPFSLPEETEAALDQAKSAFAHEREEASPGYYAVYLDDSQIACTFAASTRAAIGRFSFEGRGSRGLILGGVKGLTEQPDDELKVVIPARSGYFGAGQSDMYLHFSFDQPYVLQEAGKYYILTFPKLSERGQLTVKYGASYTSAGNAAENLHAEIPGWGLEDVKRQAEALWKDELERVKVVRGGEEEKTIFYTALYHGALLPINATDVNGQYPGHEAGGALQPEETHYIYYTPWDAFRSLHPWVNLVNPEKGRDYMRSLVRIYRSDGQLPEPRVMTSVHTSVLVADALVKGIDDFDVEATYQGLRELMLERPYFRSDMALYDSLGYVPSPHRYATTATLEFAFNDWALGRIAHFLGDEPTAEALTQRSLNYRNNYRPDTRFMESRNYDGSWADAPIYAEANRWNMSWFVPHDVRGLINLMGGDEAFREHLDRNFR